MNAVIRLNLIVTFVFIIVLCVTLYEMLQQASKDISREVTTGLSFTHLLLSAAITDQNLLADVLKGERRHVKLEILESRDSPLIDKEDAVRAMTFQRNEEVPDWLPKLIPNLEHLAEKEYFRYLPDGRILKLQAEIHDEVQEVWESVQNILMLFFISASLSNLAIYFGVRQGIKPISDFLDALNHIGEGRLSARLSGYSIKEINKLSFHFNVMAEALEVAEADNKQLTHELLKLQEAERAHLARELHDDLGQYLTGIKAQAYLIKEVSSDAELVASIGEQISNNCDAMQVSFRQLIRDLHPVILEQLGLLEAVKALFENWSQAHGIKINTELPAHLPNMCDEYHTHLYRIMQEALNNIAQHANASEVDICMRVSNEELMLSVVDNGRCSVHTDQSYAGLGLRSMKERACYMGGSLEFIHSNGHGSRVLLKIPVTAERI